MKLSICGDIEITAQEAREFYAIKREYTDNDKLNDHIEELSSNIEILNERVSCNKNDLFLNAIKEMCKSLKKSEKKSNENNYEEPDEEQDNYEENSK